MGYTILISQSNQFGWFAVCTCRRRTPRRLVVGQLTHTHTQLLNRFIGAGPTSQMPHKRHADWIGVSCVCHEHSVVHSAN